MFRPRPFAVMLLFVSTGLYAQTKPLASSELQNRFRQELALGIGTEIKTGSVASLQDARKSAGELANYVYRRTGYRLPREFVTALADEEWRARSAASPTIQVQAFAQKATEIFSNLLQGTDLSAIHREGPTPFYVVTPTKLNAVRLFYRNYVPHLSDAALEPTAKEIDPSRSTDLSIQRAFPVEAFLALYACISDDLGRAEDHLQSSKRMGAKDLNSINLRRNPFGDYGYVVRRPIGGMLTRDALMTLLAVAR